MKRCKQDKIFLTIIAVFAVLQMVLLLVPFIWVVMQSLNTYYKYLLDPFSFPDIAGAGFKNYAQALKNMNIEVYEEGRGLIRYNIVSMTMFSFVIAFFSPLISTTVTMLLSYIVCKYNHWKICKIIYAVNLFTMILPIYGSLPSVLMIHKALGTYNNLVPFLLVGSTGLGMNLILFYGAFKGLPNEYKEAATLDGAGHYTVMFKIYLPMIFPLFAAVFLLAFMGSWNDYMLNVTWLPSYPNLAYGVFMYQERATLMGASVPELLAGLVALAIPSIILWTASQKLISSKMAIGGLKG